MVFSSSTRGFVSRGGRLAGGLRRKSMDELVFKEVAVI
jgi:hypothetical protein